MWHSCPQYIFFESNKTPL